MASGLSTHPNRQPSSQLGDQRVPAPGSSDHELECGGHGNRSKSGYEGHPREMPMASESAMHPNEIEEIVITTIRVVDVVAGLRRIPAGFYTAVHHSEREWRTQNKPVLTDVDAIEWSGQIPIPSDPSATICLEIYASFELQPMLGSGEQLRKLTVSVEKLLDRSARGVPFTFFPKGGDVVSSCSSISVVVDRRSPKVNNSSGPGFLDPHHSASSRLEEETNQGHSAFTRYQKHGETRDLERSIEHFERVLSICPLNHPCRAAAQSNTAMAKFIHCRVADTIPSFDIPLNLYRNALAARPIGHPDRYSTLVQLAAVHLARFEKQRDQFDAEQVRVLLDEAIGLGSAESCGNGAASFLYRLQTECRAGITPKGRQSPMEREFTLGMGGRDSWSSIDPWDASLQLLERFELCGDIADLQQAISLLEEVVQSIPDWDPQYFIGLTNLGAAFAHRYQLLGEPGDLESSISSHRKVLGLIPDWHSSKPTSLSHLGGTLLLRFQRLEKLADLEEAISRLRDAVELSPNGHPVSLNHLGISLFSRFERLGDVRDLEEAISRLKDAVDRTPDSDPCKSPCLDNLGSAIFTRFQHLGDLRDLEEAILRHKESTDLTPDGHIRKPGHLNNLGARLLVRFDRLGDPSDLDQAIFRLEDAINLTPDGHPKQSARLSNLGTSLLTRFKHLEQLGDLEQSIFRLEAALALIPDGHPNRSHILSNLGIAFLYRFRFLEEPNDLEQAVSRLRDAVYLIPDDHPIKSGALSNLGNSLSIRFARLGELSDLEEAISSNRDAVSLIPDSHPSKPPFLYNLGDSFAARFLRHGDPSDLEQTISRYTDAVNLTPDGHPDKPHFLDGLGRAYLDRFECFGEPSDLEQAVSHYACATRASTGPTIVRFAASQRWISCARALRHHSLLDAYSLAIDLLPQIAWMGFSLTNRYRELMRGAHVVREAAAAALDAGRPETAVEWLEQGRSIVWGELFQLRSSYEELLSAYPDHARKLQQLSAALEHASAAHEKSLSSLSHESKILDQRAMLSLEQETSRHRTLAIERDRLLQDIRRLPGFERFLLHKEFSQLRASAHSGPVVILNAAETRCDALIIVAGVDHVIHVPLPSFTLERCKRLHVMLKSLLGPTRAVPDDKRVGNRARRGSITWEPVLSTLWNGIVKPVLEGLAFSVGDIILPEFKPDASVFIFEQTSGDLLRIFWCPTGPFAFLPIHAAGLYSSQTSEPGQTLFDFVISSYVPTLSILTPPLKPYVVPNECLCLLAVRQPHSDGQSRLPGVETELNYIRAVVQNVPSARTALLESSLGTVEEVLTLMKRADWVHFACHGIQDASSPTNSGLCLADQRRLKLPDIISLSRPRGGLAFLSACQTATGDEDLSDEAIHIAAGMLFAGYGGVVGTMWSISDRLAPRVAKEVYEQLFGGGARPDYREAARALHDAIGRLREGNASFVEWLPFIHVGL